MRLLVVGAAGQVGHELCREGHLRRHDVMGLTHARMDITKGDEVSEVIRTRMPDVVINAAAYTAVDKAKSDEEAAFAVNRDGPACLASVCANMGIPLVHYSTDYVFDGSKKGAYVEGDPVSPLGVYGKSKMEGELAVRKQCPQHIILRTSWVFSAHGHNFVKTMLRLGEEREEVRVVSDQFGKPTAASQIARVTLTILAHDPGKWGTYHLAQPEVTNWYGFAETIFAEARSRGKALMVKRVRPIATADYPTPEKRPANSELNCDRLERTFGISIRPWRESLGEVIRELVNG